MRRNRARSRPPPLPGRRRGLDLGHGPAPPARRRLIFVRVQVRRRTGGRAMIENILVAVDGSAHAHAAVDMAGEIAAKFRARVTLLHVMTELGSARVPDELRWYAEAEKIRLSEADILRSVANEIVQRAERRARARGAGGGGSARGAGGPGRGG